MTGRMRRASTALGQAVDSGVLASPEATGGAPSPLLSDGGEERAPSVRPRPDKPVRFTLDLTPDMHRFLKRFALEIEVDAARVMRALLIELRSDAQLAERVRTQAWNDLRR